MKEPIDAREAIDRAVERFAELIGENYIDYSVAIRDGRTVQRDYRVVAEDRSQGQVVALKPRRLHKTTE